MLVLLFLFECEFIIFFCNITFSTILLVISLKVDIIKEEAERQRMHREEIELELQKVRQQMLAVPSSGQATSSLEGGMGDFTDSSRFAWL